MAKRKQEPNGAATAVADAPKKRGRPRKQPMLNNDPAFERIKEIEDLAQELEAARTARQNLLTDEVDLQEKLAAVMTRENLTTYKAEVGMLILEHLTTDKVKIKKVRQADESGKLS